MEQAEASNHHLLGVPCLPLIILGLLSLEFTPSKQILKEPSHLAENYIAKVAFLGLILAKYKWAESQNAKLGYPMDRTNLNNP